MRRLVGGVCFMCNVYCVDFYGFGFSSDYQIYQDIDMLLPVLQHASSVIVSVYNPSEVVVELPHGCFVSTQGTGCFAMKGS